MSESGVSSDVTATPPRKRPAPASLPTPERSGASSSKSSRTLTWTPKTASASAYRVTRLSDLKLDLRKFTVELRITKLGYSKSCLANQKIGRFRQFFARDRSGTEVKCKAFENPLPPEGDDDEEDRYASDFIEVDQTYLFYNGRVSAPHDSSSADPCELTFDNNTLIRLVKDNPIPPFLFPTTPIKTALTMLPNEMINVIGVVQLLGPTQFAIGSLKTSKKEIVIADLEASVAVTLWGDDAESFAGTQGDVVTFDRIQVSVYQGKITLSAVTRTVITESPTTPAALEFKRQWDALDD